MSKTVLISDSSCDLPSSCIEKYHIELIPYYISFDAEHYYKEIVQLTIPEFYERLRAEKVFPKTSLPSINDYYEYFKPHVAAGNNVICVTLSSHFSGSYNAAVNARELILEDYPQAQIEIINSLNATGGEGVLVLEIARMIEANIPYEKIVATALKLRETARIFFFVDTLDYLEHGGRIGKASALLGSMLNVKPIIYLQDGALFPIGKVRGTKKAIARVLEIAKEYVSNDASKYHCLIAHADNLEYAQILKDGVEAQIGTTILEDFAFIGTTIGVYTGPDVGGICLIKKYETLLDA